MAKQSAQQLREQEKNRAFRYAHIPFYVCWKSPLLIAPSMLLFMSIFSILYLQNTDRLLNWYSLIYIAIFAIATLWFKAVQRHLKRQFILAPENILITTALPIVVDQYRVYVLIGTSHERHSEKHAQDLLTSQKNSYADLIPKLREGDTLPLDNHVRIGCIRKRLVTKALPQWSEKETFPCVLIAQSRIKPLQV